jgi:hypothetical protein
MPEVFQRTLEDLGEGFRGQGQLRVRMFHVPQEERVLQLPNASVQVLSAIKRRKAQLKSIRQEVAGNEESERVFILEGRAQAVEAFKKTASRAGRVLLKVRPAELEKVQRATDLARWLWFAFDLALRGELPSVTVTRRLWSFRLGEAIPSEPWNVEQLETIARHQNPAHNFPKDKGYWKERLRDHFVVEIPDLFSASTEAVTVVLGAIAEETGQGSESLDRRADEKRQKTVIRRQIKAELKSMLRDDALVAAYRIHGSFRKAANDLSRQTGQQISKDKVRRAVERAGGIQAVRLTEDSESVVRNFASQRRATKRKNRIDE